MVVAFAVVACAAPAVLRAQEKTPQARLSGAWQLDRALGTPIPEPGGRSDSQRSGGGGTIQGASDPGPVMAGVRTLMLLMDDLTEPLPHLVCIAAADVITLIDDHGISRRFAPVNKTEKIGYGSGMLSFRTRWEGSTLIQDITADSIDLTRTLETTPDGSQLTITLTIRKQPNPKAMAAQGNRGDIRKYVYHRVG